MKRSVAIISLFAILIISRLFFISKSIDIIPYITLINSISFIIVIISIIEDSYNSIRIEIANRDIPEQLKRNSIKDVKSKKLFLYLVNLLTLIGIVLSSEIYNDVLSILTIGISLLDEEIGWLFNKILRKWCKI